MDNNLNKILQLAKESGAKELQNRLLAAILNKKVKHERELVLSFDEINEISEKSIN